MNDKLLERLADECHRQWSHWTKYLARHGHLVKSRECLKWVKQANTPYSELSEQDKEKDRKFAKNFLEIFKEEEGS